jgi:4-diphosphocytidyl-2-C-methyl-D-erythritol kinase
VSTLGGERGRALSAPAKLTLSLRVTGVRDDGFHLLDAEMVSIDLADTLTFEAGSGISVHDQVPGGLGVAGVPLGPENLVARALVAVQRSAAVAVVKRIPSGAGLGGGSADAGAVLRWAACSDLALAVRLGADVPFCVHGGRARVTGVGESVQPLAFEDRRFVLVLPPISVDTGAVYRQWDARRARQGEGGARDDDTGNDLEAAAIDVAPALARWRDRLGEMTGRRPRLAGSGSSWFVEGERSDFGLAGHEFVVLEGRRAPLLDVRTVPAHAGR